MYLIGKAKEAFEKWHVKDVKKTDKGIFERIRLMSFYRLEPSMQYGVYVNFFDSVDIDTDEIYQGEEYHIRVLDHREDNVREEAQAATIEVAGNILNNKL